MSALDHVLERADRALSARLETQSRAPIALAFSGGGDSLALLLIAKAWADGAGRRLIALTVDHGLQTASAGWTRWCARRAADLDVAHEILTWRGPRPTGGLASAARAARHRLIAMAARAAGARVVLFGHTADDVLEAQAMRAAGFRVSSPRVWSPSPSWPEGRDLFILRPLLSERRSAIRAALTEAGETWIEDPANADLRQPRARARALIAGAGATPRQPPALADLSPLFAATRFGSAGDLALPLEALRAASAIELRRFLAAAIACVAGGEPPRRGAFLKRLPELATQGDGFASTVGGARVASDGRCLRMAREVGDRRSRPCGEMAIAPGEPVVWDGRFEALARVGGLSLQPLTGLAARLAPADQARLREVEPAARRSLPALVDPAGQVVCLSLRPDPRVDCRCLVAGRLASACGLIGGEAQLRRTEDLAA